MEFEEHEDQEEDVPTANYEAVTELGNSGRPKMGEALTVGPPSPAGRKGVAYRYRECLKNHAVGIGGHAVDGCGEFMPAGDDGTLDALRCAACNCHRNFHRKEVAAHGGDPFPLHHHHHNQVPQFSPYYRGAHYFHVAPPPHHHHRPLALPSTSRDDEDLSPHPSSSGGGAAGSGGSKKRYRTKFTQEQKDKMLAFAESVEWRIQKQDEAAVQQFCADAGVSRQVLKVWMHNNKHTLGKKP